MRSEEIPEEEPDEPEPSEPAQADSAVATLVPSVAGPSSREFEYRTEQLSLGELADGSTLASKLTDASKDGWDFVQVLDAGDSRVIVYRRAKRTERQGRPVGFFPPSRS